jgi:hypothetical protein
MYDKSSFTTGAFIFYMTDKHQEIFFQKNENKTANMISLMDN